MDEYQARFSTEVTELLDGLEAKLLQLEKNHQDKDAVDELFRVMHTIKGTATMFGFSNVGKLTHDVEDLIHVFRDQKKTIDEQTLKLSFDTVDLIRALLESKDQLTGSLQERFSDITSEASKKLASLSTSEQKEPTANITYQNAENAQFYYVRYQPDEDILSRGIEPLGVFEELEEEGRFAAFLDLSVIPPVEEFEADKTFLAWDIFCTQFADRETLEDVFMFFMENEYSIEAFSLPELENLSYYDEFMQRLESYGYDQQALNKQLANMCDQCEEPESDADTAKSAGQEEKNTQVAAQQAGESIRVDAKKLDELINLVSDLVTINGQLELHAENTTDPQLQKKVSALSKLSKKFRDNALDLRLVPVNVLSLKMERLVRDLSGELGKEADFITEGTNTELDKSIVARLEGPVLHIIRNCIDHAIEAPEVRKAQNKPGKGVIRFIAFYSGANVFIQIQDDGAGIDPAGIKRKAVEKGIIQPSESLDNTQAYNLIFEPGFSTASDVTNVSGRGVGLDSVKKEIADMRGQVDVESEIGLGTSITIKLPVTLSIIDTLMTRAGHHIILIPLEHIVKTMMIKNAAKLQIAYEGTMIPLIHLPNVMGQDTENEKMRGIIIRHYNKKYAIAVDHIYKDYQAVVKPLGAYNRHHPFFSGSSILGDGQLALILDINRLIKYQKQNKSVYNHDK